MKKIALTAALLSFSTVAFAEGPDMSKMGPWTRPVAKKDEKGIEALYKASEEAMKKQDVNAAAALHDFPIFMATDDSKGAVSTDMWTKEHFMKEMAPFFSSPMPKDMKHDMKRTVNWLSETMAVVVENHTQTMGKQTSKWTSSSMVVMKDGKWMFKSGAEAGWGGEMTPSAAK